ncbi:hypothetical protein BU16DRAFT_211027 [Lophium mytilinum]|uniref:Inner kinetochore subunit AME1 domain-containing protein n=1 Tax=Lophium mytilinum TaxID=390894 RepID=A0A6A6RBU8_9PEZI|nr:hypothetical protein BU16DRAFT_211027 [Lophium mytilinum]
MAPADREERRRMRQRGAGAPQLQKNIAFTFGVPPLPPQRSARRTPQPLPARPPSRETPQALQPRSTSRKTPAGSGAKRSGKAPNRQRSASVPSSATTGASKPKPTKTPSAKSPPLFVTPTVSGKRKRGQAAPIPPEEISREDELQTDDEQYLASSQRKKPSAKATLSAAEAGKWSPEDDDLPDELSFESEELQASMEKNRRERLSKSASQTPVPRTTGTAHNPARSGKQSLAIRSTGKASAAAASAKTPVQRPALRKSIGKQGPSITPQQPTIAEDNSEDELSPNRMEEDTTAMDFIADEARDDGEEEEEQQGLNDGSLDENESMDELSPEFGRKQSRADRLRSETETPAPRTKNRPDAIQEEPEDEEQEEEAEEVVWPRNQPSVIATTQSTRQHRSPSSPRSTLAGPIPVRRPKTKTNANKSKGGRQRAPKGDGKRVTIQVYRVFYPYKQLREQEKEEEEAQMHAATRIPGVSCGDVLAQITEELLDSRILDLNEKALDIPDSQRNERATLKRKRGAIQNFNSALSDQLLSLREALDTGSALRSRQKDAGKEKIKLRGDFLEIRRQREELALKMDEARAVHADRVRRMKEMNEVNTAMSDIDMAIQRGRERAKKEGREGEGPDMPIDMLLDKVAVDVRSHGGGLFDRVKGFNGRMERIAMVLEGRP